MDGLSLLSLDRICQEGKSGRSQAVFQFFKVKEMKHLYVVVRVGVLAEQLSEAYKVK